MDSQIIVFLAEIAEFIGEPEDAKNFIHDKIRDGYDEKSFGIFEFDDIVGRNAENYFEHVEELSLEDLSFYVV